MLKSKLNLAAVGVLAATLSMQSMASEVATVQAPLSVDELSFAFADVAQADVLAMSQGEMKETEGALAPLAALWLGIGHVARHTGTRWAATHGTIGAVAGGGGYAAQHWRRPSFNGRDLAINTAGGFAGGLAGGGLSRIPRPDRLLYPHQLNPARPAYGTAAIGGSVVSNLTNRFLTPVNQPNVQINHNTHQLNQQMLNQNLYGDFQRFANTQQNFQIPRRMSCVSVGGSGMPPTCSYF